MPTPGAYQNPEMARDIDSSPVFSSLQQEVIHDREVSAMRHYFVYELSGEVDGQQTLPFTMLIEQGSDFKCHAICGSCYSYDANNASDFPIPNALGVADWAGRGLSFNMVDTRSGRQLTSGFNAAENILTPGYGQMFQQPFPFRYFFFRNSKLRVDVRNADNQNRTHSFRISFHGFKIYTPE